jgi:hypothetical protein
VDVTADEAASGSQAVVTISLGVVATEGNRVSIHDAVGTVRRVATLAATAAAGIIGKIN